MKSDMKPFRIAGNLYYVGNSVDSSLLFDTGEGLILIDTPRGSDSADAIRCSMEELGFCVEELKYIIVSHGHYDHWEGVPRLVQWSGAETFLGEKDLALKPGFAVDHLLRDGQAISLGNTEIMCVFTPGHTIGAFSFFFHLEDADCCYRAGMFGGAGLKQVSKSYLDKHGLKYHQRGDFYRSIQRLRKERVDIVLGNHPRQSNTKGKYEASLVSDTNPFVDPLEWHRYLDKIEKGLDALIEEEKRTEFVNYAHRGASSYCPENTMMSFYTGLYMGANGIETDVQLTKDGIPVLFHDSTVDRVTNGTGELCAYTYDELHKLDVTNGSLRDKIVSFEDFLCHFAHQDITFAIELKGDGAERVTAELIHRYGIEKKCVVTSFHFDRLEKIHMIAPDLKLGYLAKTITDEFLEELKRIGCDEFCPNARQITAEKVEFLHREGFRVRAWNVKDEEIMRSAYECGVDGMTVNFPDKLAQLLSE